MDLREAGQQRHPLGGGDRGLDPAVKLPQLQPQDIQATAAGVGQLRRRCRHWSVDPLQPPAVVAGAGGPDPATLH